MSNAQPNPPPSMPRLYMLFVIAIAVAMVFSIVVVIIGVIAMFFLPHEPS